MRYFCVRQHDITDCGAACLATVTKQYGYSTSITKIREIAGTDTEGTNAYGMVKASEVLGFSAKAVKGNIDAFFSEFPLPAIANVIVDGGLLHYVVIHKISKKEVIIADPAKGIIKKSPEEFFKEWTGVLILLVPTVKFEKGKDTKSFFERFLHLLLPQKRLVLDVFIASIVITALGILGSFYFQIIIDDIVPTNIVKTLHVISVGVILLKLFQVGLSMIRSTLLVYLSQKLDIALLLGYYEHVLKLPVSFFGTRKVGEIISRFQDASSIRDTISTATLTIMIDTIMAVVGGLILYFKNGTLFAVAAIMVILYAVLVFLFNKPYKMVNEKRMEDNAKLTSYLVESLNGIQTIKAFNAQRMVQIETEFKFIKLLKDIFKLSSINNIQEGFKALVEMVGGVAIIWIGAYNIIQGNLTIGGLVSFNALLVYFLDPIKNLINLQSSIQTAIVASDRLGEILDLEIEKDLVEKNKVKPKELKGDIVFGDVTFRYGTRKAVFEELSLCFGKGQSIALVGESGSGKTTLAKLLLNFYQVEKGMITIDGIPISDIGLSLLREKIAYVPQDTFIFSGSIYDNITFGIENASMEDVVKCAGMAQLQEFINSQPLRYETHLDESGGNLSGGQKQRLAIARAMLKKPDILILDEATSNLDTVTEKAIQLTLERYSEDMTTIIIAHRLSTIRKCDTIFVLDKGKVVEVGNHENLMAIDDGYYKKLYLAQTGG